MWLSFRDLLTYTYLPCVGRWHRYRREAKERAKRKWKKNEREKRVEKQAAKEQVEEQARKSNERDDIVRHIMELKQEALTQVDSSKELRRIRNDITNAEEALKRLERQLLEGAGAEKEDIAAALGVGWRFRC